MLRRLRRVPLRSVALGLLILAPLPALALLCRGRSPSRFDTLNLPVWERHAPAPAPARAVFALPPAPPGTVQIPNNLWAAALRKSPDPKDAGAWLQSACVWGRTDPALAARQDRLATRLLASQNDAGWLGGGDTARPPSPALWAAQRTGLGGLLAWYALSRRPPAVYAALTLGDRALSRLARSPDPAWAEPLARLYLQTGDGRFLRAARQLAAPEDGLAQCALYEASGDPARLRAAEWDWASRTPSPALAAELLLLTGRPDYACALAALPVSGPALARAAWTRVPLGVAVHTAQPCAVAFSGVRLSQTVGAAGVRTITVRVPRTTAFRLRAFVPPGPPARVLVGGVLQKTAARAGDYVTLSRRWRDRDSVEISQGGTAPSKPKAPPGPKTRPQKRVPIPGGASSGRQAALSGHSRGVYRPGFSP